MKKYIPNLITLLNLASGFIAIILFTRGEVVLSAWVLVLALLFDYLDGLAARLLNARSELGVQLDSLADVVSFGVAPGLLMYYMLQQASGAESVKEYLQYLPVLIPVLSGLRLGIFNIDKSQKESFRGLPTPANAIFIIGLIIAAEYSDSALIKMMYSSRWVLAFFTLCFSILMVTRIPMFSFKIKHFRFKGNELRIIFIVLAAVLALGTGAASVPLIIILYIAVAIAHGYIR
ncbi:MAG: CDP-diacylglycerol--serine O-phosphatidyltransferase [Marinilabiliaceae bacterium]|jgi:CDP-diacylglycerol--serine O-phosphatidyltransferase|nr:CDP-diacylglycerol--serine O-phosphatidyltransferase [Marinilabiliaceae bacterium]